MRAFLTDPNVSKAVADFYDLEANAKQMASAVNKFKNEGNLEGIKSILNDEDKPIDHKDIEKYYANESDTEPKDDNTYPPRDR